MAELVGGVKRRGAGREVVVMSPAEMVLARSEDRALGKAVTRSNQTTNQRRNSESRIAGIDIGELAWLGWNFYKERHFMATATMVTMTTVA